MFRILNKNKGFTFLELVIVFFVVTVGILGVFRFVSYPIFYSSLSKSRLTATYLAQEGIEIVRNLRDENWLNNKSWNDGLGAGDYRADYDDLVLFSDNVGRYLNIENLSGFYGYSGGTQTKFTRKITIDDTNPEFLKVSVEVNWKEKGKAQTPIIIQGNLYDWWPSS